MKAIHVIFVAIIAIFLVLSLVSLFPHDDSAAKDIAAGRLLHEETAGDVGCASCHAMNAKGEGLAPDIRGVEYDAIVDALTNTEDMREIVLTVNQINQLVAFYDSIKPKAAAN